MNDAVSRLWRGYVQNLNQVMAKIDASIQAEVLKAEDQHVLRRVCAAQTEQRARRKTWRKLAELDMYAFINA